jgi:hypothetical protein
MIPLDQLFGVMKCRVTPPTNLYFPVLPERNEKAKKVMFHLKPMIGTWTSMELQKAVSVGYVIEEVYEQHHFPRRSNELFKEYNMTFFDIKRQAALEGKQGVGKSG